MDNGRARHVLVAAGGTGGHLFPAEALAAALARRGVGLDLATDSRAAHYGGNFPARATHIIPSSALRGRDPFSLAATAAIVGGGVAKAWLLLGDLKPTAVIGFGGYPTVPPLLAASLRGIPTIIHEQNAVIGPRQPLPGGARDRHRHGVPRLVAARRAHSPLKPPGSAIRSVRG